MAIRLTGLNSGMDTEAIVKELMSAHKMKLTKIENKKTKNNWSQDKWKELNKKIYALYTGDLSKAKLSSSFQTKKASSSNNDFVEVTGTTKAAAGAHKIQVNQLASSQYVTGKQTSIDSTSAKLVDQGFKVGETIEIKAAGKDTPATFTITSDTTVKDFVDALKQEGLSANYDTKQKRFFIASAESGADQAFSITSASKALSENLGLANIVDGEISDKEYSQQFLVGNAVDKEKGLSSTDKLADLGFKVDDTITITNGDGKTEELKITASSTVEDFTNACKKAGLTATFDKTNKTFVISGNPAEASTNGFSIASSNPDALSNGLGIASGTTSTEVKNANVNADMTLVKAQDAEIVLDGATMTVNNNNPEINGLRLTLKQTTTSEVTLTVTNDTKGVYDMVSGFIKGYNDILKTMNEAFYAKSAKGYEPLTDEEKEVMTDDQIEKWETKIKDSLLRRDPVLGSLITSFKAAMSIEITASDGKKYSLASLGICTSSDYSEKGLLHIKGDADDSTYSDETNILMNMLETNPEIVEEVVKGVATELYKTMTDKMGSSSLSSALTFYNDKQMTKLDTQYDNEIKKMKEKLQKLEDRYYAQFSAMEKAMANLNAQQSSLAGLLGM